jgi:hypothetical protein
MKLYRKISVDYSYEEEERKEKMKENEKESQNSFQSSSSELQLSMETQQHQKSKFEVSFVKKFSVETPLTAPVPSSLVISLTPRVSLTASSATASSSALSSPHPQSSVTSVSTAIDSLDKYYNSGKILSFLSSIIKKIPLCLRDRANNELPPSLAALGSMSFDSLFSHLLSLRTEYITRLARPLLNKLYHHPKNNGIFNKPVDYIALQIPSYPIKVKKPMDLGTVRSTLHAGGYEMIEG